MADLDPNKPGVEHQNISENDSDGDSLPEYLILSEPLQDPYDSDILEDRKKEKSTEVLGSPFFKEFCTGLQSTKCEEEYERKDSSHLSKTIVDSCMKPVYNTRLNGFDFVKAANLSLSDCVEELLDFALEDFPDRRTIVNGKKLFYGKSTEEIIQFWTQSHEKYKWIFETFTGDIVPGCSEKITEDIKTKFRQAKGKKKTLREKQILIELESECLQFVNDFLRHFSTVADYNCSKGERSRDELNDKFKHVVQDIASLFGIKYRSKGECKMEVEMTEVCKERGKMQIVNKDYKVTAKPDLVLKTFDEAIEVPVEVHAPVPNIDVKGATKAGDLSASQICHGSHMFDTQHILQHIGLLLQKQFREITNQDKKAMDIYLDKPCISVGMFLTKGVIHFSKVKTTPRHLSSFNSLLVQMVPAFIERLNERVKTFPPVKLDTKVINEDRLKIMFDNIQDDGLMVIKSQWHIDLSKCLHRNALFIFMLHYFKGYAIFFKLDEDQ